MDVRFSNGKVQNSVEHRLMSATASDGLGQLSGGHAIGTMVLLGCLLSSCKLSASRCLRMKGCSFLNGEVMWAKL